MEISSEVLSVISSLPDKPVHKLSNNEMKLFRRLIGWEEGGAIVAYPTEAEKAVRKKRETWKRRRAGKGKDEPCLLYRADNIARAKKNIKTDRKTALWFERLIKTADQVATLPKTAFIQLIEDIGSWGRGSFCPNCVWKKSAPAVYAHFWKWSVHEMESITCPYCGITYPHPSFPEEGVIELPRLGLKYPFYLDPKEKAADDWRLGEHVNLLYGIFPSHVSFSSDIRASKFDWALGQVEPLSIAFALIGRKKYARTAEAILLRLAEVYHKYPMYSYIQDFIDAEPGYAIEHAEKIETIFKKNAFLASYTGIVGKNRGVFGQHETTTRTTRVASGAWGCTRLAQEKSSTGQVFLSLFKGYDLIKSAISHENRVKIEQDFLLELYLDVKALSRNIDNKTGPGAAACAAVGIFYNDEKELKEGIDYFHKVIKSQHHPDGSPKETPNYAAKPLYENLWEIPEIVRDKIDLYSDGIYRKGLQMFADIATPLGTQPPVDDSEVMYFLPREVVDVARIRVRTAISYGPRNFAAFNLVNPKLRDCSMGYVARLGQLPKQAADGFHPVGWLARPLEVRSAFSIFNEALPAPQKSVAKKASNHYYHDRGLALLGFGSGRKAAQLYLVGEDGRTGHRHSAPLSLMLFANGREVFPDLGYLCDHPGNKWVRATPSHNTVTVDERSRFATGLGDLNAFYAEGPVRFVDITTPVKGLKHFRRAVMLIKKADGLPIMVDIFDVSGGKLHDYQMRVNDPDRKFSIQGLKLKQRKQGLYADESNYPLRDFRTGSGAKAPFSAVWGKGLKVKADILTTCNEVITCHTPAWRDFHAVFETPKKAFDTLILRREAGKSRFIVVYELYKERPSLRAVECASFSPVVMLQLFEGGGREYQVAVADKETELSMPRLATSASRSGRDAKWSLGPAMPGRRDKPARWAVAIGKTGKHFIYSD